jgi:hypothetical protein
MKIIAQRARARARAKIDKWDYMKLKSFSHRRKQLPEMKRQFIEWEY